MFFKRKSNEDGLYGKIEFKYKVFLLSILVIIAIGVVTLEGYKNIQLKNQMKSAGQDIKLKEAEDRADAVKIDKDKLEKQKKEEKVAKNALEEKDKVNSDDVDKAYSYFSKKNYEDAIKLCDDVIVKDSNFYKAYNVKGITLAYSGQFDEGMKNIDKALELKNDFGFARFNKALTYEIFGKYDEALEWYFKDLEIEKYVWTYYGISSIYGRNGDVDNTVKYLKLAIDIAPEVKEEAKTEVDFNPVKDSSEFQELIK